jgi:hypothetical protein
VRPFVQQTGQFVDQKLKLRYSFRHEHFHDNFVVLRYSDSTCSINNEWVSQIFSKLSLRFEY